jgi:metal-responsive CopG/Arc/MetJ family transcriptional regulator
MLSCPSEVTGKVPKSPKRERPGFTRWPVELEEHVAKEFEETMERVYPLAKRNSVIRELIVRFIADNKEKGKK